MSDISRRDALRRLALVLTVTGTLDRIAAAEVHQIAAASQSSGGAYAPKSMTDAHFKTLERLTDLINPVENGAPGAVAAGCAQWIDTISAENDQLKTIYRDGLTWLDNAGNFFSNALHVVERFTLVDPDTIHYEARIEDPKVYTRPWTIAFALTRNTEAGFELLEQACHEGNYSLENSLSIGMKPYRGVTPPAK